MNILLPIAPQDALGQSPSLETGTTPEGEGTGFAEALTAALVVPLPGEAKPVATAATSLQADGSLIEAAQQGGDEPLPFGKNQPLDGETRSGALGPGSEARGGLHDPLPHDGTADHGKDRTLPPDPENNLIENPDVADVQTQPVKAETSSPGREQGKASSAPGYDLTSRVGDNRVTLPSGPDHRNHVPQDVARAGFVDRQQAGQLPAAGFDNRHPVGTALTEHLRSDPATSHPRASAAPAMGPGLNDQEQADALQRGQSSSLLLMAQQTRSAGITDPASSARLIAGSEPSPLPTIAADQATVGGAPPLPVAHRDPTRPEGHLAIKPDQAALAVGSGSPSDGLPEPILPPSRPAAARPTAAINADGLSTVASATLGQSPADPSFSPSTSSPQNQAERSQASPLATQAKPVSAGAAADPSLQAALADVAAQPDVEAGGSERFQPFLSAEVDPYRLERLDLSATSGASTRLPGAAAQPAASGQIALQILHSASDGVDRVSLQLHPAELGSVDIELNFEGGGRLSALITAERPETLELLQRDSRLLERSLGDSGLKLASDGLSFALKQDQQQQQPGQNFQQQAEARENASRADRAYDDAADIEQDPSVRRIDGLRLLDIET